jgi:hypothetical protein
VSERLTARPRSAPPLVRPSCHRLPRVAVPPRFSLKPVAAPHHLLPICAGAHREEPPYCRSFDRHRRRDPLHGAWSPEHPPCRLFLRVYLRLSPLFLPTRRKTTSATRAPTSSENSTVVPVFPPFLSARSSGELPPSPTCPVGGPSTMDARGPHVSHSSTASGQVMTRAR